MTEPNPDHFEMRRLESLSNTIFGVAMTLLAYDLPKAGQFQSPPGWTDLYHLYAPRLSGLVLSFVIAGYSGSATTSGWPSSLTAAATSCSSTCCSCCRSFCCPRPTASKATMV